jgi:hypothetical protein
LNDNAYKLELPPEFRVSPTFNILDLRSYLGEEDELELRTTPIQEGEDDEDITLSDIHNPLPLVIQGPITRACARQLNQQVNSFLSSHACTYENSTLPNEIIDYIVLRNFGEDHEGLGNQQGQEGRLGGASKSRWRPKSSRSGPSRTPGPVCTKFIAQATNRLRFQ